MLIQQHGRDGFLEQGGLRNSFEFYAVKIQLPTIGVNPKITVTVWATPVKLLSGNP